MSRPCDAIGCNTPTATGRFMCPRHWRLVPVQLQKTINTRYRELRKDFAFLSDVLYLQACVDAIDGLAASEGKTGTNPYLRHLVLAQRRRSQQERGASR